MDKKTDKNHAPRPASAPLPRFYLVPPMPSFAVTGTAPFLNMGADLPALRVIQPPKNK